VPTDFVNVASLESVPPGSSLAVEVEGKSVALFNAGGTIYALENYCPHQGAPLVGGWIDGTTVTCPWHAWCFNLEDGSMTLGAFAKADPYDVRVEDGRIAVSRAPRTDVA
jgi:nitrite reductase/ring-hydroxylating ferredoxin subunit